MLIQSLEDSLIEDQTFIRYQMKEESKSIIIWWQNGQKVQSIQILLQSDEELNFGRGFVWWKNMIKISLKEYLQIQKSYKKYQAN